MTEIFGFDAYSPREIAERVENVGVAKASLPLLSTCALGVLAGGFIGLGGLYSTVVASEEKGKTWHRVERSYGAFSRSVTLPVAVKTDKIEAESKDGVLTIAVPKSETVVPKKIPVTAK